MKLNIQATTVAVFSLITIGCGGNFKGTPAPAKQFTPVAPSAPDPVPSSSPSPGDRLDGEIGGFGGGVDGSESAISAAKLISSQCDGTSKASAASNQVVTVQGSNVLVKGEFCPTEFKKLNIVFMIDSSASMGNKDEITGGKCFRSDAARSLLAKINDPITGKRAGDSVNVSIVAFAREAITKVSNRPIDSFIKDDLTIGNFCGDGGVTNFEDGFDKTAALLTQSGGKLIDGNSIIYIITDGRPTTSNTGTDESGALAGVNRIYALGSNVTVNALFVGEINDRNQEFMTQLTKDPKRVIAAAGASDIGAKLAEFQFPKVEMKVANLSASISDGSASKSVKVLKLEPHPTKPAVYLYELESVAPFAKTGVKTKNTVKVVDSLLKIESLTEFEY